MERLIITTFLITAFLSIQAQPVSNISKKDWQRQRITQGIIWKQIETDQIFDSHQSINILEINRKRCFAIDFEPADLKLTSQFAVEENALAAVNAGFFNMKEGGSVTFMKVDDKLINPHLTDRKMLTEDALAIDEYGKIRILKNGDTSLLIKPACYDDILFTGPLLLYNNQPIIGHDLSRDKRHPRTCICVKKNNKVLLITVDGRHGRADGMTIPELTQLLQYLECQDGINLDGGGSTTMWIKDYGVVNHPSDNKKFDTGGERKVANVLLVY